MPLTANDEIASLGGFGNGTSLSCVCFFAKVDMFRCNFAMCRQLQPTKVNALCRSNEWLSSKWRVQSFRRVQSAEILDNIQHLADCKQKLLLAAWSDSLMLLSEMGSI